MNIGFLPTQWLQNPTFRSVCNNYTVVMMVDMLTLILYFGPLDNLLNMDFPFSHTTHLTDYFMVIGACELRVFTNTCVHFSVCRTVN